MYAEGKEKSISKRGTKHTGLVPNVTDYVVKGLALKQLLNKVRPTGSSEQEEKNISVDTEIERIAKTIPFGEDSFVAATHVNPLFESRNHDVMRRFLLGHLTKEEKKAAEDLQRSVHGNYKQFMDTSNQIELLEGDVLNLRNHLTEVNSVLKGLNAVNININKDNLTLRERSKWTGYLDNHIHWFLELPHQLDILTSERMFDEAIKNIQNASQLVITYPPLAIAESHIKEELNQRIRNLSDILLRDLQNPGIKNNESQSIINYLQALDFSSKAQEVFLETRTKKLQNDLSNLTFDGDVRVYIEELSRLVFSMIRSTSDDFKTSFNNNKNQKNNKMILSGFVVWVMKVLRQYRTKFKKHVFEIGDREDFKLMGDCFEIAKKHSMELEVKGLSLMFYLQQAFHQDLLKAIDSFHKRIETSINGQLSEEKWECRAFDGQKKITESGVFVYNVVQKFSAVIPLVHPESSDVLASTLSSILEKYLFELSTLVDTVQSRLGNRHYLGIVSNAKHLSGELLSSIIDLQVSNKLISSAEETKALQSRLHALYVDIQQQYCNYLANDIVNNPLRLDWGNTRYIMMTEEGAPSPSLKIIKLFEYLFTVASEIQKILGKDDLKAVITSILDRVLLGLSQGPFWKDEKSSTPMFSAGGISQFVIDMKYAMEASGPFLTNPSKHALTQAIERALVHYCITSKASPKSVFMDDASYKLIMKATLEKFKSLASNI
uniref:Exocyst component Exo84 C-terminal domain-containing protein n=1 Tax=Arcella intermedia TaxID=1963864 RepID=A0A6B2KYS5_9EUKA